MFQIITQVDEPWGKKAGERCVQVAQVKRPAAAALYQCTLQKVFPRDEKPLLKGEMPNRIFPYIMLTIVSTFSIGKKPTKQHN